MTNYFKLLESLLGKREQIGGYGIDYFIKIKDEKKHNPTFQKLQLVCNDFDITLFDYCYLIDNPIPISGADFLIDSRKKINELTENSKLEKLVSDIYKCPNDYWIEASTIHRTLRSIRNKKGISATKLSAKTHNIISVRTIYRLEESNIENPGHCFPKIEDVFFLGRILGINAQKMVLKFYETQFLHKNSTVFFTNSPIKNKLNRNRLVACDITKSYNSVI